VETVLIVEIQHDDEDEVDELLKKNVIKFFVHHILLLYEHDEFDVLIL